MSLEGHGVNAEVHLHLPMFQNRTSVRWFEELYLSLDLPPDLDVTITGSEKRTRTLVFKTPMSSVTSLHFLRNAREADRWIKYLARPVITNGVSKWPMPRLHTLTFDDDTLTARRLKRMLVRRYGSGHDKQLNRGPFCSGDAGQHEAQWKDDRTGGGPGTTLAVKHAVVEDLRWDEVPVALGRLEISGYNKIESDGVSDLENIIGSDTVVWKRDDFSEDDDDYIYT